MKATQLTYLINLCEQKKNILTEEIKTYGTFKTPLSESLKEELLNLEILLIDLNLKNTK